MNPIRLLVLIGAAVCLLTGSALAEPLLPGVRVLRDLPYVTNGHARQKLDLYLLAKPKGPLLVYIHGGGWRSGSKDHPPALPLLMQGYSIASLEYRWSQDAVFPAQIEDCKAAIRWLRAHAGEYGYRMESIAAFGESAGGQLTALLATTGNMRDFDVGENLDQSSAIQCGIDWFGPTNFPAYQAVSTARDQPGSVLVDLFGGPLSQKLELARRASPVTWVDGKSAPLYIMHGTRDPLVPLDQSKELAGKFKKSGVEVTLDILEGAGHGGPQFWSGDKPQRMLEFLNRHLADPGKPIPPVEGNPSPVGS